ncbi:MAG: 4-hydroxythreonine-4-phosphate dehydrogenase PdxA [Myxococcota bacterium]|nr:4-hydroxythreonine-4-phosphate dehydrogenase PdxA [Myxococcota bacterium]
MTARIAVSVGCPCGIGPEVSVVAAAGERRARVLLVGDAATIRAAGAGRGIDARRLVRVAQPGDGWRLPMDHLAVWQPTPDLALRDRKPGTPTAVAGAAQLAWIDEACDLVARGDADALVTAPVSKETIAASGAPRADHFLGHTEHLQRRLRAPEVVMAFWSRRLVTSLATTHVQLARVPRALTPVVVARATYWLAWLLCELSPREARISVASLNPHAGEGGLLGSEESRQIVPGIALARRRLRSAHIEASVEGPVPAETAFRLALEGRWDGVVAMYHDQATIPMKVTGFGAAVNVSLGLPIVRTSVDHGTAYDRAGTWAADARGMRGAIRLAWRLVTNGARSARSVSVAPRRPTPARPATASKRRARSV